MIEIQVTKEMWEEWVRNPVTNQFFKEVSAHKQETQRQILEYNLEHEGYKKMQGMYKAYNNVLDTRFEDLADD